MASEVSTPALILALVAPLVMGLTAPDGPRAYYVGTAALVAGLLILLRHRGGRPWLSACWFGAGLHALIGWCGLAFDVGACDEGTGLPVSMVVLIAMAIACEVAASVEAGQWRRKQTG